MISDWKVSPVASAALRVRYSRILTPVEKLPAHTMAMVCVWARMASRSSTFPSLASSYDNSLVITSIFITSSPRLPDRYKFSLGQIWKTMSRTFRTLLTERSW